MVVGIVFGILLVLTTLLCCNYCVARQRRERNLDPGVVGSDKAVDAGEGKVGYGPGSQQPQGDASAANSLPAKVSIS